jgi:hypothetical protein
MVAVLFRLKLRRRTNLHRAPVHRAAADSALKPKTRTAPPSALSFPALNGGAYRAPGQPSADIQHGPITLHVFRQRPTQQRMVDIVEQPLDVKLQDPIVSPTASSRDAPTASNADLPDL